MKILLEKLAELARLQSLATPGPWHPGCLSNDTSSCNCRWVLSEGYAGSICTVDTDNELPVSLGGNDSPPLAEAKANLRFIAAAGSFDFAALHAVLSATPVAASVAGELEGRQWVIVSMIEGRGKPYWRPNSAGYTDSFTDAGRYTYSEARAITSGCHGDAEKYCVDDPALYALITHENLARGKEIKLWLQSAAQAERIRQLEAAERRHHQQQGVAAGAGADELGKWQHYVAPLLNDLLNHPDLPASIQKVLWQHRQQLTVKGGQNNG